MSRNLKQKITFDIMFKNGKAKRLTGHYVDIIEKMGHKLLWIEPSHIAIRINKTKHQELN